MTQRSIPPQPSMTDEMAGRYLDYLGTRGLDSAGIVREQEPRRIEARIGDTRACPDCGRPQHYTGTEMGWCHDATFAMLACGASPALLAELEK